MFDQLLAEFNCTVLETIQERDLERKSYATTATL